MVENGNKTKGVILTILLVILLTLTIVQVVLLNTTHQLAAIGYKDPDVSQNHVRGTIFDRNGKILAIQAPEYGFSFIENGNNHQLVSSYLSEYTNYNSFEMSALLDSGTTFIPMKGIPTSSDIDYYQKFIEANGLSDSVSVSITERRKYPTGILSDILGKASSPYLAKGGIEELFNQELAAVPTLGEKSVHGKSLVLTVDQEIQMSLENAVRGFEGLNSIIIFSQSQEILAAFGNLSDKMLENMVYSISTDEETTLNPREIEEEMWAETVTLGTYAIYIDSKNKEAVFNNLQSSLSHSGKI